MSLSKKRKIKLEQIKNKIVETCDCSGGCQKCGVKINEYLKIACANIPLKFWECELDDLNWAAVGKEEIINYVNKLESAWDDGIGLYICGTNGIGKSLSAALICKAAIRKGYTVKYMNLNDVISAFGDGLYDTDNREQYKKDILNIDFLILDDIDKTYISKNSNYAESILDNVFRYRANENYPTIVTANKTREDMLSSNEEVFAISLLSLLNESLLDVCFMANEDKRDEIKEKIRTKYFGNEDDES